MKNEEKLNKLREIHTNNKEIIRILDSIDPTNDNEVNSAWKIFSNPRIIYTIDIEESIDVLISMIKGDKDAYKNMCQLVRTVYGESSEKIIQERPELSINDIPNFDIFDEQIRETIGYGGVHTFLTYNMTSEGIITKLVQNPELIRYYKEFEGMTGEFFPPSAIGLEDRLLAFDKHSDLIREIVDCGKQSEYTKNLLLFLRDEEGYSMISNILGYDQEQDKYIYPLDPENDLRVKTLKQLGEYKERRKKVLQGYLDKSDTLRFNGAISQILMFKHFGIVKNSAGQYNAYDHKKVLQDYLKFNKTELSEDEVDLIEIYSILEDTKDPELLKQIDKFLSDRDDVVTPLEMKIIDNKVVENYKREYLESLITIEQARQMAEDPENKSYRYICKKNGDICYPTYMYCDSDGSTRYKDHVQEKRRRLYISICGEKWRKSNQKSKW